MPKNCSHPTKERDEPFLMRSLFGEILRVRRCSRCGTYFSVEVVVENKK
jgi:hypothetical protein